MVSRVPLVVVLGATGVGKSKLGIELAKRFNGEVISADSMQVYKGLDIITNKVTEEEAEGVPHHLMDFLDPLSKYTVVDYRNAALPIINRLREEGKMPVVVGGTNYYIESLLWKVLVEEPSSVDTLLTTKPRGGLEATLRAVQRVRLEAATVLTALDLAVKAHEKLRRIHENRSQANKIGTEETGRKLLKAEECLKELVGLTGKLSRVLGVEEEEGPLEEDFAGLSVEARRLARHLETLAEEPASKVVSDVEVWSGAVQRGVAALWEAARRGISSHRLHHLLSLLDPATAGSLHPNNTRKILRSLEVLEEKGRPLSRILEEQRSQEGGSYLGGPLRFTHSIIFWLQCQTEVLNKRLDERVEEMLKRGLVKELLDFHDKYNKGRINSEGAAYTEGIFQSIGFKEFHNYLILSDEERATKEGERMLEEGIAGLKTVTRRYAKKQAKWINNRFLKASDRQVPRVVRLDTTEPGMWEREVLCKACEAVDNGETSSSSLAAPSARPVSSSTLPRSPPTTRHCTVCRRLFVGDLQWEAHMKSKKHKAMLKRQNKSS